MMQAMSPSVILDSVNLRFAGRDVLNSVSLEIGASEFVGLLGANGAGKTTLLRSILGLVPTSGGHISVFGAPVKRGNPAIGYMPQARSLLSAVRLKGWDVVASSAEGERLGLPYQALAARQRIDRALGMVEALQLANRPFTELSGGEKQRILLAQALVSGPRLLLLDEPLLNLDPAQQRHIVSLIKHLNESLKLPVIFSSHELNPLLNAIHRVIYLGQGNAAIGSVQEVITAPVLSRLYGAPIEVYQINGRIFVMSGDVEIEREAHRHDDAGEHNHDDHRHV